MLLAVEFEKEHTMLVTGATTNETGLETMIRCHKGNIYLNSRHCEVRPERTFEPNRALKGHYQEKFGRYTELYARLKGFDRGQKM